MTENQMFSLDSLKEFVCLFVCPRKQEAEEKNFKSLKKKRKKTTVCRLFTHDYHYHVSLPPRDRERDGETERFCCCCREEEEEDDNRI